jgi:hypothetical protein
MHPSVSIYQPISYPLQRSLPPVFWPRICSPCLHPLCIPVPAGAYPCIPVNALYGRPITVLPTSGASLCRTGALLCRAELRRRRQLVVPSAHCSGSIFSLPLPAAGPVGSWKTTPRPAGKTSKLEKPLVADCGRNDSLPDLPQLTRHLVASVPLGGATWRPPKRSSGWRPSYRARRHTTSSNGTRRRSEVC